LRSAARVSAARVYQAAPVVRFIKPRKLLLQLRQRLGAERTSLVLDENAQVSVGALVLREEREKLLKQLPIE
jgi:hypothetical protein